MIDVNIGSRNPSSNNKSIEHNSILIVGKGDTDYKNKNIVYPASISAMEELYGKGSELTVAYIEAKNCGATQVFVLNCNKFTDYIDCLNVITQTDFAFICPLFNFSTTFVDPTDESKRYLAEVYSNALANCFSTIIFSDKHASLYEDLSSFMIEMIKTNYDFKDTTYKKLESGENIAFVLNNLQEYKYANVALAAIISNSDLRNYPSKNIGDVVYDITANDIFDHEMIYFAYNSLTGTTIENLQNYYVKPAPEKMLLINIIKNRINMAFDYDEFTGKLINKYTKIKLENYTKSVLQSFVGTLIEKYNIKKIDYVKATNAGEIDVFIYFSIKPYNSIEVINMTLEV